MSAVRYTSTQGDIVQDRTEGEHTARILVVSHMDGAILILSALDTPGL